MSAPTPRELEGLCEVFATVDTVFSEFGAFGVTQNPGLGRIYRSWQRARKIMGEPVPEASLVLGGQSGSEQGFDGRETPT